MEIEKKVTVAAPAAKVWETLLDPNAMGGCVPGMQSIEVISPTEYVGVIKVKISFISAKFRINTRIVEQRAPQYMRIEGTGEDASVASSLKQQSEIFLAELPGGQTELRIAVKVDVLGRLGTFGLSVMKTKADRMWDEFSQNLASLLNGGQVGVPASAPVSQPAAAAPASVPPQAPAAVPAIDQAQVRINGVPATPVSSPDGGWWSRLLGGRAGGGKAIHVELRKGDTTLTVDWPAEQAVECAAWLRDALK